MTKGKIHIQSVFLAFILLVVSQAHSQTEMDYPACTSVIYNGNIAVNITESYTALYKATDLDGTYSLVTPFDTVMELDTIVFTSINGNTGAFWIYFDSPTFKDTISNIWLNFSTSSNIAELFLEWNLPFGSGSDVDVTGAEFIIEWDYPSNSGWSEFKRVPLDLNKLNYEYDYIVDICSDSVNFRISLPVKDNDGNDCHFYSNVRGKNIDDQTFPSQPEILTVTVDTALNHAALQWKTPSDPDVFGYVIYEPIGNNINVPIEEIWDSDGTVTTYYVDLSTNPDNKVYSFSIAAFDSCPDPNSVPPSFPNNISPPTDVSLVQHTILLNSEFLECDSALILNWNKYDNYINGVDRYELYLSEDGSSNSLVTTLDSSAGSYEYKPLNPNIDYCFIIKAIPRAGGNNLPSLSNIHCKFADFTSLPDSVFISKVTTDFTDNNRNYLTLFVDDRPGINMQGFSVEAKYPNREYTEIGFLSFTGDNEYQFEDPRASEINAETWYRVLQIDVCGADRSFSNEINSVHLGLVTDSENAINTLVWNEAKGRAGEIYGYNIYRQHKSTGDMVLIRDTLKFQNYYEDDLGDAIESDGRYCYVVEVIENRNGVKLSNGFSNMECGLIEPRVWIPNAFIIGGTSPTFKPVFAYADLSNYDIKIVNRKGIVLFTSNNADIGWDGSYKGNFVNQGVYVYIIEFKDGNGKVFIEKGTVTVF